MLFPRSYPATHSGVITVTRVGIGKHFPENGVGIYARTTSSRSGSSIISGASLRNDAQIQAQSWDTVKDKVCLGPKLIV
jgi:hypothetical protein